jgi:hypothetical protein
MKMQEISNGRFSVQSADTADENLQNFYRLENDNSCASWKKRFLLAGIPKIAPKQSENSFEI